MKKLLCLLLALCLVFTFIGCRRKKNPPANEGGNVNPTTQNSINSNQTNANTKLVAVSVPAVTETTTHDNGTTLFQYTYQNISLVLDKPDVADKITLDFLNRVDTTTELAHATAEMAKSAYNSGRYWTPYLYHITYSPTRIDSDVLSFFGNNVVYSGAGHPEHTCVSASYDLNTGDVLTLASIMNKDATTDAICNLVLSGLSDIATGNYLYDNYKETVKQRFATDASQDEAWYFTQEGLCFYFAPYEIAPYSSRVISVEIPYGKLTGILHSDYLPLTQNQGTGTVTVKPFESVNLDNFSHIAEIVTNREGQMYMAGTDGTVQDVRILHTDKDNSFTVFAANRLTAGDGIMIQADADTLQKMKLTYKSNNQTITQALPQ